MADIAYDNSGQTSGIPASGDTMSFVLTVGNNPNRYGLIGVASNNEPLATGPTSGSMGGVSGSAITGAQGGSNGTITVIGIPDPPTGPITVSVSGLTSGQRYVMFAYVYYNVNASQTPNQVAAQNKSSSSSAASVTITPDIDRTLVWAIGQAESSASPSVSVGGNNQQSVNGVVTANDRTRSGDYGIISPPSAVNASASPASGYTAAAIVALAPFPATSLISVTDSTTIIDVGTPYVVAVLVPFIGDSTTISDSIINLSVGYTVSVSDSTTLYDLPFYYDNTFIMWESVSLSISGTRTINVNDTTSIGDDFIITPPYIPVLWNNIVFHSSIWHPIHKS